MDDDEPVGTCIYRIHQRSSTITPYTETTSAAGQGQRLARNKKGLVQ